MVSGDPESSAICLDRVPLCTIAALVRRQNGEPELMILYLLHHDCSKDYFSAKASARPNYLRFCLFSHHKGPKAH